MKPMKRILSLVLSLAMVLSCVPAQVFATETCDHSYETAVTEAGCAEEGSVVYTCTACGDSYEETVAAAGHNYVQTDSVEAACSTPGSVTYTCDACGDSYQEEIPAVGHAFEAGACTVCGEADPDAQPAEEPTEAPVMEIDEDPMEATEEPTEEPTEAQNEGVETSGTYGSNVTWTLDESTGVLTISGQGAIMEEYSGTVMPWYPIRDQITAVEVEWGITEIPPYAFEYLRNAEVISLPNTLTTLALNAFNNCESLNNLLIPASVQTITSTGIYEGRLLFNRCYALTDVYYVGTADEWSAFPCSDNVVSDDTNITMHFLTLHEDPPTCTESGTQSYYTFDDTSVHSRLYDLEKKAIVEPAELPAVGHNLNADGVCTTCGAREAIASGTCGENLTWTLDGEGTLTISGTGDMENYTNSSNVPWYNNQSSIQSVVVEAGVTSVGNCAFQGCSSLTGITLPKTITDVGSHTFYGCSSLTSVTIPEGVTSIGYATFYNCSSLTSVILPKTVTDIGKHTFFGCSGLTSVTIPEGVTSVGYAAFHNCTSLTSVTIPEGVTSIGDYAFSKCTSLTSVTIPEGVTSIGDYAFSNCSSLTSATIPEGITSIGSYTFYSCDSLVDITVPEGVISIGSYAFQNCSSLTSITLPGSLTQIAGDALQSCSNITDIYITNVAAWAEGYGNTDSHPLSGSNRNLYLDGEPIEDLVIPEGVTYIAYGAFRNCGSLTSITLPESLTEIHYSAFYNCNNITEIYITNIAAWAEGYGNPDSSHPVNRDNVQQINLYLDELPVTNVVIPEGVAYIGYGAFRNIASLRRVTLPASVTSIGDRAFYNCSGMTKITLAEGLTTIGNDAFSGCTGLRDVVIPEGVTGIGNYAFSGCEELETVGLPGSLTTIGECAFQNCRRLESIDLPEGITKIAYGVFSGCTNLESVTLPDTLTSIGNSAFSGCSILPSIILPDSVTTIGNSAFSSCSALTSITLPEGVTSIGNSVFYYCKNLSTVALPDSLVSIGTSAFYNSGITSITIPKGISYIEDGTFSNCSALETVNLPDGLLEIGENAFYYCRKLTNITLPDSITDIGNYAFRECAGLTSIVLPAGLTRLEENVFYYCTNLESVTLPEKLARIYKNAFQNCVKLTGITFPASLTRLDANIFSGCSKLTDITFNGNAPQFHATTFTGVTADAVYPASNTTWTSDKLQDYGGTINWISSDNVVTPDPSDPADMVTVYITLYLDGKLVDNKPVSVPTGTMMDASAVKDYACQQLYPEYFTEDYVYVTVEGGGLAEDISSVRIYFETAPQPTEPIAVTTLYIEVKTEDGTKIGSTMQYNEAVVGETYDADDLFDLVKALSGDDFTGYEAVSGSITIAAGKANGVVLVIAEKEKPTEPTEAPTEPAPTEAPETEPTVPSSQETVILNFKYLDPDGNWTSMNITVTPGENFPIPATPVVSGKKFTGWVNNYGGDTALSIPWYSGMPKDYIATYVDVTEDNFVDLTVYAYYYVGGEYHHKTKLLAQQFVKDGLSYSMGSWLLGDGVSAVKSALAAAHGSDGYLWNPATFYNCYDDSEITEPTVLLGDDNKSVYVKVTDKEAVNASVMLHVHTAQEATVAQTIKMSGYTVGDFVSVDDVLAMVGNHFTGDNMTMSNLYDAGSWEDLMNGQGSAGATTIKVAGDTVEIHVILTDAEPVSPVIGTVKQNLNVRSAPSTTADIVKTLEAGTKVEILQIQTVMGVEWGLIADGWILMAYVDLGDGSGSTDNTCGDNLTWSFDKDTGILTISGTGDMYDYGIGGMPWVAYKDEIRSVVIKEATYVGAYAFYDLPNLKQVTIPLSVAAMGDQAFSDSPVETAFYAGAPSQWEEITQNNSGPWNCTVRCEKPGKNLFWYLDEKGQLVICGSGEMDNFGTPTMPVPWEDIKEQIQQVWIKEDVTSIGTIAFRDCPQLTAVTVLKGVKDIALGAFGGENKLQSITVDAENAYYTSEDGVLFNKDKTVLLQYPSQRKSGYYSIPEGVTEIATGAFENCDNLSSVGFPASLKTIDHFAFMDSDGLKQIRIPDNVTEIGNSAFVNCTGLQTVVIGSGIKDLGICVFSGCTSLTEVELPDTLVNIWECVFQDCTSLKRIVLPAGLNFISDVAFSGCTALEEIVIGGVKEIYWAFENCTALQNVYFRGDAPTYSTDAFQTLTLNAYYPAENATWTEDVMQSFGGNITWIPVATAGDCGDNVTWSYDGSTQTLTISGTGDMADYPDSAPWAAYGEEIKKVVIENGVTSVGDYAFYGCDNLLDVYIPQSLTTVGDYGLRGRLHIDQTVRQWYTVEMGAHDAYYPGWDGGATFRNDAPIVASGVFGQTMYWEMDDAGTATIFGTGNSYEFWATGSQLGNYPVRSIIIEEGVSGINLNAFEGLMVENVTIASTVKTIETMVFADCTSLNTITFLGDAPAFGENCFRNVTATAFYPADNATWTADVMQNYEGSITWIPSNAVKNRITVEAAELNGQTSVWIDGKEYTAQIDGELAYVDLPDGKAKTMTVYTYHVGDLADIHTQYPVSMKVWMLSNTDGYYTAARAEAFDDILQYSGMSIRVFGKKGIRMITSIEQAKKAALTSGGLEGYTLKEYGTAIAWSSSVSANKPLVLGKSYVRSNYAYKEGIADPVFKYAGDMMQYTNVMVDFTNEQCKNDIAMRPYMILEDENGEQVTLYGGIVNRSIGYIAYQNRVNVFEVGSDAYEYVWDIIHYVYGTIYDKDYIVSWSPPAM